MQSKYRRLGLLAVERLRTKKIAFNIYSRSSARSSRERTEPLYVLDEEGGVGGKFIYSQRHKRGGICNRMLASMQHGIRKIPVCGGAEEFVFI